MQLEDRTTHKTKQSKAKTRRNNGYPETSLHVSSPAVLQARELNHSGGTMRLSRVRNKRIQQDVGHSRKKSDFRQSCPAPKTDRKKNQEKKKTRINKTRTKDQGVGLDEELAADETGYVSRLVSCRRVRS